jgi:hypothetical protein
MDQVYCNNCGELLSLEAEGTPRQACPNCGSMSRKFARHIEGSIKPSSHLMATHSRDEQPIGFTESERPELTRYASLEPNGNIRLNLRGLAPRNEQDSDLVCATLVTALNTEGSQVRSEGPGEQDEDYILVIDGIQLGVQVVRALTDPQFWKTLAHSGEVGEVQLSISDAASALKMAIEHKTSIPLGQRDRLILVLDAYRLPALSLGPVTSHFRKEHGDWAQALGFHAIYLVGPLEKFVSRLDGWNIM